MRFYAALWLMLACLAGPTTGIAQNSSQLPIVGWLTPATTETLPLKLLRDALAKQGYVEGRDLRFDIRIDEGRPERLPQLAAAMVHDGVSVILASGEQARAEHSPNDAAQGR